MKIKENFEITNKLALLICNKRIEYGNSAGRAQSN
jgi:hypothetical protein